MKIKPDTVPSIDGDLLGRSLFAREIKNAIIAYSKKNKDAFTLAITGEWGSGKSTLLNYIKTLLQTEEADFFTIIEFNPWMFLKNESIKQAFLIELALALKDFETKRTKLSEHLKDFIGAFKWIKYVNSAAGNIQQGLDEFFDFLGKADSINDIKSEIEKILHKSRKKIFVLIDDMDRLMPEQIAEVLQTISLITNFSNIIYVLAFDRQIVIDALNKQFTDRGQDYLEKIIQVDYELPRLNHQKTEGLFNTYIAEFRKDYKISFDNYALHSLWDYHGLKEYFKNIRDYKRFFNGLAFRLPVIAEEVNTADFLVIESIRIFDYKSYEIFYNSYNTNLRRRELSDSVLTPNQLDLLRSPAGELLKAIFPKSTMDIYRKDSNSKRLHDPAYFHRYFSLLTSENDINEKSLREIIYRPERRKALLNEAAEYNRIDNLIKRLTDNNLAKHYPDYNYSLVDNLISFFNANGSLFEKYSDRISDMIINLICCNKHSKEFLSIFFASFEKSFKPAGVVHIYFFHYMRLLQKENRRFRSDHYLFDEYYKEHFDYIKKIYLPVFKGIKTETLFQSFTETNPFIKYLYQINYAELFPEEYLEYLSMLLNESKYIIYMASQLAWIGDKNELVKYKLEQKDILYPNSTFIEFYLKLKDIDEISLNEKERAARKFVLAIDITEYPKLKFSKQ